ncbi:MAG: histidine kinase [Gammaproteobacteria bacterium]|nr:histidine kinase [Gammaproteobacteria bacterium]
MAVSDPLFADGEWRRRWPDASGAAVGLEELATPEAAHPWLVVLTIGGLCWMIVTLTGVLWMLPQAGMRVHDVYIATSGARVLGHCLVFLLAAPCYRLAVALGWPAKHVARVRVVLSNALLALGVVALAPIALVLSAGVFDNHLEDMRESFALWLHGPSWDYWTASLRLFLPPYVLGLCAIALTLVTRRQHREALRAAELASACSAARMAMLSAQLQPHFLFNSLHAISVLIEDSPREAAAMLARLGDFLRHALESSHWPWVDVATELAGLEAYLAVQQVRFADGLRITIEASPAALTASVPALLLQPLAENAIEHGRDDSGTTLHVRVNAAIVADRLRITVCNSNPQLVSVLSPSDYGHGLTNVELRLRAAYGADAQLSVGPDPQGGTTAVVDVPHREFVGTRPAPAEQPP